MELLAARCLPCGVLGPRERSPLARDARMRLREDIDFRLLPNSGTAASWGAAAPAQMKMASTSDKESTTSGPFSRETTTFRKMGEKRKPPAIYRVARGVKRNACKSFVLLVKKDEIDDPPGLLAVTLRAFRGRARGIAARGEGESSS